MGSGCFSSWSLHTFLLSKIFFSETALIIKVKFHVDPPWEGWMEACLNGPGLMTKMPATPINGKNLQNSSSPEQEVLYDLETWHEVSGNQAQQSLYK